MTMKAIGGIGRSPSENAALVEPVNRRVGEHLDRTPQNGTAQPAVLSTMPNAMMPASTPSSWTTIPPACGASTAKHRPSSLQRRTQHFRRIAIF
jgi:hypothetical protein